MDEKVGRRFDEIERRLADLERIRDACGHARAGVLQPNNITVVCADCGATVRFE